jgi:hypothetical protein
MMKLTKLAVLLLIGLGPAVNVPAEELKLATALGAFGCQPLDLSADDPDFTFEISVHFSELQQAAVDVNTRLCNTLNNPVANTLPSAELGAFGLRVEADATKECGDSKIGAQMGRSMRDFSLALNRDEDFPTTMPDIETIEPDDDDASFGYSVTVKGSPTHLISPAAEGSCRPGGDPTCADLVRDLSNAVAPYKRSYQRFVTDKNAKLLTALQSDWNAFFDQGRSMTTLDLILTSIIERDHMRQGFLVGPVERQWFLLHPNLVMQYSDDETKGDRFKAGLSIDWFGVNYWQDSILGIPFGAALTSVYSDRPQIDTVGHGVTLYFDNNLMIGWTKHGDDNAYHVSVDLLDLFTEKKAEFERYKDKVLSLD